MVTHTEHGYFPEHEVIRLANIETEVRWRRTGSKERWTVFSARIIGDFQIEGYPKAVYDVEIRTRQAGTKKWSAWEKHILRASGHPHHPDAEEKT